MKANQPTPQGGRKRYLAANVAAWSFPFAVVAYFGAGMALLLLPFPLVQMAMALPIVAMAVGTVAAIVALSGIKQYGRRRILWRSIVGLILPILYGLLALFITFGEPLIKRLNSRTVERAQQLNNPLKK